MKIFKPHGPFIVPLISGAGGRVIDPVDSHFWNQHSALATKRGCYIFAIRASKGCTPYYAGKATQTFKQEVFTDRNIAHKFNPVMTQIGKGTAAARLV